MFPFKKKRPPELPDPLLVAIRDLETKLLESQAAALAAKWQVMKMREEQCEMRQELRELRSAVDRKRVIRVPLTLTVDKSK